MVLEYHNARRAVEELDFSKWNLSDTDFESKPDQWYKDLEQILAENTTVIEAGGQNLLIAAYCKTADHYPINPYNKSIDDDLTLPQYLGTIPIEEADILAHSQSNIKNGYTPLTTVSYLQEAISAIYRTPIEQDLDPYRTKVFRDISLKAMGARKWSSFGEELSPSEELTKMAIDLKEADFAVVHYSEYIANRVPKPSLITFAPHCRRSLEEIPNLQQKLPFMATILGIISDNYDDPYTVSRHLEECAKFASVAEVEYAARLAETAFEGAEEKWNDTLQRCFGAARLGSEICTETPIDYYQIASRVRNIEHLRDMPTRISRKYFEGLAKDYFRIGSYDRINRYGNINRVIEAIDEGRGLDYFLSKVDLYEKYQNLEASLPNDKDFTSELLSVAARVSPKELFKHPPQAIQTAINIILECSGPYSGRGYTRDSVIRAMKNEYSLTEYINEHLLKKTIPRAHGSTEKLWRKFMKVGPILYQLDTEELRTAFTAFKQSHQLGMEKLCRKSLPIVIASGTVKEWAQHINEEIERGNPVIGGGDYIGGGNYREVS